MHVTKLSWQPYEEVWLSTHKHYIPTAPVKSYYQTPLLIGYMPISGMLNCEHICILAEQKAAEPHEEEKSENMIHLSSVPHLFISLLQLHSSFSPDRLLLLLRAHVQSIVRRFSCFPFIDYSSTFKFKIFRTNWLAELCQLATPVQSPVWKRAGHK